MKEVNTPPPGTGTKAPPPTQSGWQVKGKFLVIGLLVGLLAGGLGALKVYTDQSGGRESAEERVSQLEAQQRALQARAAVATAASELSRQNFGTAREKLSTAKELLGQVNADAAGLDPAVVKTIQDRLNGVEISTEGPQNMTVSTLEEIGLALDQAVVRGS